MHYRQIYETYHQCSLLPGIEIHHIDGNSKNNDPSNLLAVTIEEHLAIHTAQEDWGAVQAILMRMESPGIDAISVAASLKQRELLESGEHNFQKMSRERRKEISQKAGLKVKETKVGIFAIPEEVRKENSRRAGQAAQKKRKLPEFAHLNTLQGEAVKGTKWWLNTVTQKKIRSATRPEGSEWIEGMGSTNYNTTKTVKDYSWWTNTDTGERKRSLNRPDGPSWIKGMKKE